MKVGFTGTQVGMTDRQKRLLRWYLRELSASELHHGDCIGADDEAATMARKLGLKLVMHPPRDSRKRALNYRIGEEVRDSYPYLVRNRYIVDETEVLIAAPKSRQEELRSGTWSTVRYARGKGRKVYILEP
jgi:hypothetical protein